MKTTATVQPAAKHVLVVLAFALILSCDNPALYDAIRGIAPEDSSGPQPTEAEPPEPGWAWMGGSAGLEEAGVYGTRGVPDAANWPGGRRSAAAWIDVNGDFWLFGGFGLDESGTLGYLNDLWRYDGVSWTWEGGSQLAGGAGIYGTQEVPNAMNMPGARLNAMSWSDGGTGAWLFGGIGRATGLSRGRMNDLWRFDGSTWTWMKGASALDQPGLHGARGVPGDGYTPSARHESATWSDTAGNLWLYGGWGPQAGSTHQPVDDLWRFDGSQWALMSAPATPWASAHFGTRGVPHANNSPGARQSATTWSTGGDTGWLFGGIGYDGDSSPGGEMSDLWTYDPATAKWTWVAGSNKDSSNGIYGERLVAAPGNMPGGRHSAASWTDHAGNLWLFGGEGYDRDGSFGSLNDLWRFDGTSWTWMAGSTTVSEPGAYGTLGEVADGNTPGARFRAASWTGNDGTLWLFGGVGTGALGGNVYLNDLWRYTPER